MSALAVDLRTTAGFLVADAKGRIVGRVECPMYGTSPETPDALSVRSGIFARRRRLVPAESIEQIDNGTRVIGLRVERGSIKTFLESVGTSLGTNVAPEAGAPVSLHEPSARRQRKARAEARRNRRHERTRLGARRLRRRPAGDVNRHDGGGRERRRAGSELVDGVTVNV